MTDMQKDPTKVLLFGILTCGIYIFIWMYQTLEGLKEHLEDDSINPTMELVLSLVTCGVYMMYWNYLMGERIERLYEKKGKKCENEGTLFLILSIFGLSFVSAYLMQERINKAFA